MAFNRRQKHQRFSSAVFILFLLILLFSGPLSCAKGKKAESTAHTAEINEKEVASENASSPEPGELEKPTGQNGEVVTADAELAVRRMENAFGALEDAVQRIPRETFDPEAVAQKAGSDAIKLFEWVRDETNLIPYQGSLRGPVGVLMDRRGNSLDRALLLCELLRLAGHEARLARRHLSEDEAMTILKRTESKPGSGTSSLPPSTLRNQDDLLAFYVQNHGLDRKNLVEMISRAQTEQENRIRQIKSEHKEMAADIIALLNKKAMNRQGEKQSEAAENLRDHWWVQWEKGDDWVDFDPASPGANPGQFFGEPEETFNPEDLEEDLFHSIKIRIIAEQFEAGELKEKPVLEHVLIPSKTLGQRMVVRHLPLNWPSDGDFLAAQNPLLFLKDAVAKQAEWQAVLEIDGEAAEKSYVTAQGNISNEPSQKPGRKKGKAGGIGDLFGGLAGKEEEKEAKEKEKEKAAKSDEKAFLTAEWLEFEIRSPGRPVQIHKREVFDLIGPAARQTKNFRAWKLTEKHRMDRALKILDETEVLPLVCELSPEFIEERTASYVLLNREVYLNLVENYGRWDPQELFLEMTKIKPMSAKLSSVALKRLKLSPYRNEIFLSTPNLLARRSSLTENDLGELITTESIDIIANDISPARKTSVHPFSVHVEQGILDTLVEAQEMGESGRVENTAVLFKQSRTQGINWLFIQGPDDPNWKRVQVSADARARLEQEIGRGFDILVPEKEIPVAGKPRFAWWRLNPETGNFLGVGEKGAGQAMTEYAEKVEIVLQLKGMLEYYGALGRCLGAAITAPLRGNRPQHDELVIECIWNMICSKASDVAEAFLDIETNWTNVIIKATLNWAMGSLCEALWEKGIKK